MEPHDFCLCLQHLGLTDREFADLIVEDIDRVHRWTSGVEKVPYAIDLLTYYWCEFSGALEMAKEASDAYPAFNTNEGGAGRAARLRSLQ